MILKKDRSSYNFMVYRDRLEASLFKVFAHSENSE